MNVHMGNLGLGHRVAAGRPSGALLGSGHGKVRKSEVDSRRSQVRGWKIRHCPEPSIGYQRIMRITVLSLLLTAIGLSALSAPARAEFTEIDVTVAEGVAGKMVTPARGGSASARAVLLFHGWTGKMDEVGDMFKRLGGELGEAGIASLRINFRGEGERNGHRLTSTFATRIADAEAALAMIQEKFPDAKIGVVGFSLGGATALALTGRHPEAVTSLVLCSRG